jgi:hypothetical protein
MEGELCCHVRIHIVVLCTLTLGTCDVCVSHSGVDVKSSGM